MKDSVLVLGAGNSRDIRLYPQIQKAYQKFDQHFKEVYTVDMDVATKPTLIWDLERWPWPIPREHFDEVHAYEILEHLGQTGDYESFFQIWRQIWTVLKLDGLVYATTPFWKSVWAWGDPGHRRVYSRAVLAFLDQRQYTIQVGVTPMTDYREFFPPPFSFALVDSVVIGPEEEATFGFILQKKHYVKEE